MSKVQAYLTLIDQVIEEGPYQDNWASLSKVKEPAWYKNAKFGIFIHWGVYAVPAFGSEWYIRNMYQPEHPVYAHHVKTYGSPKEFPYVNFIPMFKAENYEPKEWAKLFKDAGARFVMPVAEHHDGFQMYDSDLSTWNAVQMGPKRDVMGDLKKAVEDQDLVFTASSHRAENVWFCNGAMAFDSGLDSEGYIEPYGYRVKVDGTIANPTPKQDYGDSIPKAHLEDWLARTCELVDKYQPKVVWFDWWIQNIAFKPYLKKFAAYYYNRAVQWGIDVAINYKDDAYAKGTAIFDVERGQLAEINPRFWQTDTAIGKNSWGYTEGNVFKEPENIVCDMLDIVSKNGAMLLNVGPKADGTITDEETAILRAIGEWLKKNGEAFYDSTYWSVFGEGPTAIIEGQKMERQAKGYVKGDIRYTYKAPYVYAHVLKWPKDGKVTLKSFALGSKHFKGIIKDITLLAFDHHVNTIRNEDGLHLSIDDKYDTIYPVTVKIQID
ncbi:alpha-L-fucosidase [Vallitalea pronyensis]|uniref:alpha-L-fucosidase n=1 Tax=Vallitalea pronyensis TaxID=1348613 RepID=A0A8J8SG88_9FIRM|nr:alpha-L-fucosidase [Vallitalea pronyensis]QUI22139.1 alpha-L-fucosidase [Vallitalea pronyensis]